MNPDTPKIVAAFVDLDGYVLTIDANGRTWEGYRRPADARLAKSGQRAIWPDGHGVAAIEDIPKPEPLPTIYVYRSRHDRDVLWPSTEVLHSWPHVATVTFDEDGNAHVERVTP